MSAERTAPCASPEVFDDEREPTLVTGMPLIELSDIDVWLVKYPDGEVAKLAEVVS